jgi:predicted metal-dependent hydrolase
MVYGAADYMGMPWETLIKAYRDKLGGRNFEEVEEYAMDFLNWLKKNEGSILNEPEHSRPKERSYGRVAREVFNILENKVRHKIREYEDQSNIDLNNVIDESIKELKSESSSIPYSQTIEDETIKEKDVGEA